MSDSSHPVVANPLHSERTLHSALGELLEIAASSSPLEEKLTAALIAILKASGQAFLPLGSIFLVDPRDNCLRRVVSYNLPIGLLHDCTIVERGHCLCGRVAQDLRTIYIERGTGVEEAHGHYCAPIVSDGDLVGVLNIFTSPHHGLRDPEIKFLNAVAHGLALLIKSHRSAEKLAGQLDLLGKVLDHVPLRVFWKDCNSVYRGCNLKFARDVGVAAPAEVIGKHDGDLPGRRCEAEVYRRRDQRVVETGLPLLDYEEMRQFADGEEAMIVGSLLPLHRPDGGIDGILGIYSDVSGQRETEYRLQNLTINDQLTGLPNLTLFRDRLEQAIISTRYPQRPLGLIYLDLDNFTKVNNTLGHASGDEVLRMAGARLQQTLFDLDSVGRVGGDVFVLLLRDLRQQEDVTLVLQKVRQALSKPFLVAGHEVFVTASMGVAIFPHDGADAATLMQNADTALHQAKEMGRNGYQLYSPAMNASALRRLSLESQLRKALELQQFRVHYQPQVAARDGRLVGAEALVRWQHPDMGMVAPGDFISLAEETGLIVDIGAWVINEVCVQAKRWLDMGLPLERVAVNLSPRQFQHHDIVTTVCAALLDSGLDPACLELEITESAVVYEPGPAAEALNFFREMGVRIAIDDFGTGYSSLVQLKKFPFTLLKIDRIFVQGIGSNEDDDAIVTAVIAMARKLGLKVLAEGVETTRQRDFLRDNGCDELQGYLFSRPLAPAQFEALLVQTAAGALPGTLARTATVEKSA